MNWQTLTTACLPPKRQRGQAGRLSHRRIFGSVLREDYRRGSDVDVLVEFEPGATPGFDFVTIQDELSEILGRDVDLHTPASLSTYIRDQVLRDTQAMYDAA